MARMGMGFNWKRNAVFLFEELLIYFITDCSFSALLVDDVIVVLRLYCIS